MLINVSIFKSKVFFFIKYNNVKKLSDLILFNKFIFSIKVKLEFKKQKKTIRRTFRVGRSKHQHNIGVIINNKTIRNECSTKKHLLKQTSINDVKQFLLKKGLIKIGTTAPNDVLRKMYETANLICGDVHNHNSDILLHNYFNNA